MILSFEDKHTEKIWRGYFDAKLPAAIQEIARRKLRMLHNSQNLNDLRVPPANRLEKLSGNLAAYHSIRINDKWRIIFKWETGNAYDVSIVDYH